MMSEWNTVIPKKSSTMTTEQIAQRIRKVLDTRVVQTEPDVRNGVVMVAHQLASLCAESYGQHTPDSFLRQCGL